MIEIAIQLISWILLLLGSFFFVIGAVGLVRLPDVYTRMHAISVTDTLGVGLLLSGLALQSGWTLVTAKLIILGVLIAITGPIATHALAQAALHMGIRPKLQEDGDIATIMPIALDNEDTRSGRGRPS